MQNVGHLFAALDIEAFMPIEVFQARMDQFVQEVHAQPRLPGVERIFVPGEIEFERAEQSIQWGVSLPKSGWQELDSLAERLGVPLLSERLGQSV